MIMGLLSYMFVVGVAMAFANCLVASVPILTKFFGWILFPDFDVSVRGEKEFKKKYTNPKFVALMIPFGWARLTYVAIYHLALLLGFVGINDN